MVFGNVDDLVPVQGAVRNNLDWYVDAVLHYQHEGSEYGQRDGEALLVALVNLGLGVPSGILVRLEGIHQFFISAEKNGASCAVYGLSDAMCIRSCRLLEEIVMLLILL